ncbi:MAG: outer membrane lipoprotein LolB [Sulfuritalea sp.]|nr:outer membrane lipoprotein LolB [Sulfuritalea sp.]
MRSWLVCLGALLLAACAEFPPQSEVALTLGPPLQRFAAEGRISLRQGDHRDHLRFRWEHDPNRDVVLLMSPLGQGLAELTRDAAGARLVQPNQAAIVADTLPQLAQRVFGAPLPLEAMADWLRGARPALSGEIDGWRVVISDTLAFRRSRLLRVMEARREDVELKLVVDDWDVPE